MALVGGTTVSPSGRYYRSAGFGRLEPPASPTHSVLDECASRQSIMLQTSVYGIADQTSSVQADSHVLLPTLSIICLPFFTIHNSPDIYFPSPTRVQRFPSLSGSDVCVTTEPTVHSGTGQDMSLRAWFCC